MQEVYNYLNNLINYNENVVAAISGGPDSMFLLQLLIKVKNKKDFKLIVAHINHNVRIESEEEKKELEKFCIANNIIFEYLKIEKYSNDNFHEYTRKIRYDFFNKIVNKYHAKYLMTAHHGDDLIETIMMRLVRGSTTKGYAGFSKINKCDNYYMVRPLINLTKQEIKEYMDKNNFWYAVDKSNCKDVYTRNRFRKYILPKLKEEDKNVHLKFIKFSENIHDISNFIEKYAKKRLDIVYCDHKINIETFIKEEKVVQDQILHQILQEIYKDDIKLITSKHIELIHNIIKNPKTNLKINLPLNFCFIKTYNFGFIVKNKKRSYLKKEIVEHVFLDNGKTISKIDNCNLSSNNVIYLNSQDLNMPLFVRYRKNGDKMLIKNMNNYKKVKDIFINEKIPINLRDTYPIVVDSNDEIIWIPGIKKSHFDSQKEQKYDIILKYH